MAKRKRSNDDGDGEVQFPEEVIQLIQSFLPARQAAQTSAVSKSWYHAWLTRPNIDLVESEFRNLDAFSNFTRKMLQRYEDLNLKIETLRMDLTTPGAESVTLVEMIKKVVTMGIKDINVGAPFRGSRLPYQILEAETLVSLSLLNGWYIDKPSVERVRFSKLKRLTLQNVCMRGDICVGVGSAGMSVLFPCLEDLTIRHCDIFEPIQFSSPSLKCISLEFDGQFSGKFHVPNIRKFKFVDKCVPSKLPNVFITTVSTDWESDVCLQYKEYTHLGNSWPLVLKRFLRKLSGSKVFLHLIFDEAFRCSYNVLSKGRQGFVVENLRLSLVPPSNYDCFLVVLFRFCHPKCITLERVNSDFVKFMYDELIQDGKRHRTEIQEMFTLHGLGQVSLECFHVTGANWQPYSSETWLSASWSDKCKLKVRYRLEWHGENAPLPLQSSLQGMS